MTPKFTTLALLAALSLAASMGGATAWAGGQMTGPQPKGACTRPGECRHGYYCRMGEDEKTGICTEKPRACPRIYKPVCGRNGVTYANACEAAQAGINVARQGRCDMRR